jgi:hypothetical protein
MSLTKVSFSMIAGAAINPKDYGAVGDGVTNDTAAVQAAINALPTNGVLVGANGATYVVTSLNLKSNMKISGLNLKTLAGSTDFVSPITINGTSSLKENIVLEDVVVDGNRQNQTDIISGTENGGRHGFRVIGRVNNLWINRCIAKYCAGDGLELFSSTAINTTTDNDPCFNNIYVTDCQFFWNRRHGVSLESANSVYFTNVLMSLNGRAIDAAAGYYSGLQGSSATPAPTVSLYGNGIDIEGYGVGTKVSNIFFDGCTALQNVRSGFWVFDTVNPTSTGFAPRGNIVFDKCVSDPGVGLPSGLPAFYVAGESANELLGKIFDSIVITNSYVNGGIVVRGTDGVVIGSNTIDASSTAAILFTNSTNVDVEPSNMYKAFAPQNIDAAGALLSFVEVVQISSAQTIPATTTTPVVFETEFFDRAGEWDGVSTFTAKRPGVYCVSVALGLSAIGGTLDIFVNYGGVSISTVTRRIASITSTFVCVNGSAQMYLKKGDTITISAYSNSGSATIINQRLWNTLNISRVQ